MRVLRESCAEQQRVVQNSNSMRYTKDSINARLHKSCVHHCVSGLVQFRVFLEKRTKQKYARQITLLRSDRERKRIEKEKRLLESAPQEEGIVVSLNNGFGFIKSNRRREDVYFHYSHLIIPELDEDGNENGDGDEDEDQDKDEE